MQQRVVECILLVARIIRWAVPHPRRHRCVVWWLAGFEGQFTLAETLTKVASNPFHTQCKLTSEERGTAMHRGSQLESHADVNQLPK